MCRGILFLALLAMPGIPLAAQNTIGNAPARVTPSLERVAPRLADASVLPPLSHSVPQRVHSLTPLLAPRARAQMSCPNRTQRVVGGVVLGLVLGGGIGYLHGSAGHPGLPHTGLDFPEELEYTPFFALAGGIAGGLIGVRTARCA